MSETQAPVEQDAKPAMIVRPATKPQGKVEQLPPYHVVLLDDNEHSYDYVIEMLSKVFGHSQEKSLQMAKEVDTSGRVIVLTTHKERAELKRDQISTFGRDHRIMACQGSMSAMIEQA
jgi:ATP-dependent Clp protease adaptor protein ClpS